MSGCPRTPASDAADAATTTNDRSDGRDDAKFKQLPLSAMVNPLNRAFVPRPLPSDIDGMLRLPRRLVSMRQEKQLTGSARGLCLAVLRRLVNIKDAHQRGAGKVGLAGQFNMSAKVLTSVDAVEATPRLMEKPPGQGQQRTVDESMCKCKTRPCADKVQIPEMRVHAKLVSLARLPRDWERMLDAVRDSWELGDGKTPPLKTLVQGSSTRQRLAAVHTFGRAASSMVSKRRAIATAAAKKGGWGPLRTWLRAERARRHATGEKFGYCEVQMFCSAFLRAT